MIRSKAKHARALNAHRRYTDAESRALDRIRQDVVENGLESLAQFVNHTGPWAEFWPVLHVEKKTTDAGTEVVWIRTLQSGLVGRVIHGEPCDDAIATELQQRLRTKLERIRDGQSPFGGPLTIKVTYRASTVATDDAIAQGHGSVADLRVESTAEGGDLGELLEWFLLEAIRTGRIKQLRFCQVCGRVFFAKSGLYCGPACKAIARERREASRKETNRRAQQKWAQIHLGTLSTAQLADSATDPAKHPISKKPA
jgi:hypothetical protein